MSLTQRFISGASFSVIAATATKGAAFLNSVILARYLGANDFGIFSTVNSMVNMSLVFSIFGLNVTATKLIAEFAATDKEKAGRIMFTSIVFSLLISAFVCLLIFLLSGQISSNIYSNQGLEPILKIAVIYLFFVTLANLGNGIIQGFQDFKAYARASVITSFLTPPIVLLFAWKWSVRGAILAWAIVFFVNTVLLTFAVQRIRKKEGICLSFGRLFPEGHQVLNFALPVFLMGIVVAPANWLAYTYLAHTFGFHQVGVFNVANAMSRLVLFLPMIILTPILPIFSEIQASGDHQRFSKVLGKNLKLIWLFTLPMVVLICCLSKNMISLIYGAKYEAAFVPACIMLFTALFMVINSATGTGIISSSDRIWHGFGLNLFWFLTFVTSSYFLIPLKGALGLSLAFVISYVIFSFAVWLYSVSVMKTEYPRLSGIILLTVISAAVSLGISVFLEGGWILVGGVAFTTLLVVTEWRFFLRTDEKNLLLEKLQEYKSKLVVRSGGRNVTL
jgi:O-antigen/teichoic acid export membrane protein